MFQENDTYYGPYGIRSDSRLPYGIPDWRSEWRDVILPALPTQQITQSMSYIIRGLEPRAQYEAKVQARNRFGWSPVSDPFTFETTDTGLFYLSNNNTREFQTFYSITDKLDFQFDILKIVAGFQFLIFKIANYQTQTEVVFNGI